MFALCAGTLACSSEGSREPEPTSDLKAEVTGLTVEVTWKNPKTSAWVETVVVRYQDDSLFDLNRSPERGKKLAVGDGLGGGEVLFVGKDESVTDEVEACGTFTYQTFTRNQDTEWSSPESDEVRDVGNATWYSDADADGAGDPDVSTVTCGHPQGFVDNADDCEPSDGNVTDEAPSLPMDIVGPEEVWDSFTEVEYSVPALDSAKSYTWSLPPGASVVEGEGSDTVLVNFAGASSGDISVTAENGCGVSEEQSLSVSVLSDTAVTIPDPALESCIRGTLEIPVAQLYASHLLELTTLDCPVRGISDLSGLEWFTNLERLLLASNDVSDLTPLAGLAALRELRLDDNAVTDISPIAGLTGLEALYIGQNDFTDLASLSPLSGLKVLDLRVNGIVSIAELSLVGLEELHLPGNEVTDISVVTSLPNLVTLNIGQNAVTDLSALASVEGLVNLYASDNELVSLAGLENHASLSRVSVDGNSLTSLAGLSGTVGLTELIADTNQITDISALSSSTKLTTLSLFFNKISSIAALSGADDLVTVDLSTNFIADISALSGTTQLESLKLYNNSVADLTPLSGSTALVSLQLSANDITTTAGLAGLVALRELNLSYNQISSISGFAGGFVCSSTSINLNGNLLDSGDCVDIVKLRDDGCTVTEDDLGC
jgi:internalin A